MIILLTLQALKCNFQYPNQKDGANKNLLRNFVHYYKDYKNLNSMISLMSKIIDQLHLDMAVRLISRNLI